MQSENNIDAMTQANYPELPLLVVMLTYNDFTVADAAEVFAECEDSDAEYWGMKEQPLPLDEMKALFARMKAAGKKTVLEVVAYSEEEGLRGAETAAACGCDFLMGTKFHKSIADYCRLHDIRYIPFVGTIAGRPSVLTGEVDEIIAEADMALSQGAYGVDLLGYRYVGDAVALNKALAARFPGRVCIAGSVDSYVRLDEIREAAPAWFTIGSAFFNHKFGDTVCSQINTVCRYLRAR